MCVVVGMLQIIHICVNVCVCMAFAVSLECHANCSIQYGNFFYIINQIAVDTESLFINNVRTRHTIIFDWGEKHCTIRELLQCFVSQDIQFKIVVETTVINHFLMTLDH